MKGNILKIIGVTVFFASVFLFVSCSQSSQDSESSGGSVTINLPNENARLAASDFNTYKIVLKNSAGSEVQSASVSGGSYTFNNLLPDYYTISVVGGFTDSTGAFYTIASGEDVAIVTAGETAQAYIVLKQTGFFVAQLSAPNNGWQDGNDESNSGASPTSPYKNLQTAIEKVVEKNDGESEYTIYVKGTLYPKLIGTTYKMADFSNIPKDKNLNISIVGVNVGEAQTTLSGYKTSDQTNGNYGIIVAIGGPSYNYTYSNLELTLRNLTIKNGKTGSTGVGGIHNGGADVTIDSCTISDNIGSGWGGAIVNNSGTLKIINSTMENNSAENEGMGGAIYNYVNSTVILNNSTIKNNVAIFGSAFGGGGAIYNYGTVEINSGTIITENKVIDTNSGTAGNGGAICNYGTVTINDGEISNNTAGTGGAIYNIKSSDNDNKLYIGGSALITSNENNNDIYLSENTYITITSSLKNNTVARITPANYSTANAILVAENDVNLATECSKFTVTPKTDSSTNPPTTTYYTINSNGGLKQQP